MKPWTVMMLLCAALPCGLGCSENEPNDGLDNGDTDVGDDTNSEGDTESDAPVSEADVCNFSSEVSLGEPDEDGMILVPPNHPEIRYFGRIDCANENAPSFAFPAVSIRAKFEGDAVGMIMNDHGSVDQPNFYNIIIDNKAPSVLEMTPGENAYLLGENLGQGAHIVEVFKRVEANSGTGQAEFLGFRIPEGKTLLPLSPRPYRLEVIGDSITCGYGNEISVTDPDNYHYTTKNSNAYNAWGSIAARDLDAEIVTVAYSGRGVFRNYSGQAGDTLPEMYLKALPNRNAEWEVARYTPQVVAVNLGTNDFSPGIDDLDTARGDFELSFLEFVEDLREFYPKAAIILAVGPMLSDSYPSGYNALTNVKEALKAVIAARAEEGDENLHFLDLKSQSSPYGEDWHPTVATQTDMAEALVDLIDDLELM